MLSLNNYTEDFKKSLKNLIKNYENNKTELKVLDSITIIELSNLINDSTNFSVPFAPSKYKGFESKQNQDLFDFSFTVAFEFDFNSFSKETYFESEEETKMPCIIFRIKNTNKELDNLSKIIGDEINGDLVFMVRKINDRWELPLTGISISETKITDVIIFKTLHFDMEIQRSKDLLDETNHYHKMLLTTKIKEFSSICLNNKENIFSTKSGLLVPEFFLNSKIIKDKFFALSVIEPHKNSLFYLHALYNFSIKF